MANYKSKTTRLEETFRQHVLYGDWPVGELLPSRASLAAEYGVTVNTIRRVLGQLESQGLLRFDSRRGAIVTASASNAVVPNNNACPPDFNAIMQGYTVGIICPMEVDTSHEPNEVNRYYSNFDRYTLQALERELSAQGAHCLTLDPYNLQDFDGSLSLYEQAANSCMEMGAQAVVAIDLLGAWLLADMAHSLPVINCPSLAIVNFPLTLPVPHIYHYQQDMGYLAAETLLRCGYQRQLFIAPYSAHWLADRIDGARQAISMQQNSLATLEVCQLFPTTPWPHSDPSLDELKIETQSLIQNMLNDDESLLNTRVQHGPPGIIAANDVLANIVLEILQEHGLTLGSDYGLVGFDGSPLARMGQFTSVRPSFEVLGKLAGLLILQALQGYSLAIQTRVQPEVVQRTSTKRHRSPS